MYLYLMTFACNWLCTMCSAGKIHVHNFLWNKCRNDCINNCNYESFVEKLTKCQSANKLIYTKLISAKCTPPTRNQQKWLKDCHLNNDDSINWRYAYQLASKYTKSTRILEFQYKFLHRRIATNDFLTKIGVRDNLFAMKNRKNYSISFGLALKWLFPGTS